MDKHLHIICLDIPYPVDYGGVFDLFYKIQSLHKAGIKIHLHCFEYGRKRQPELNKYCESVRYYKRNTGLKGFSTLLPYIVSSRKNDELLEELLKDDFPILMEGIHCSYLVRDKRFMGRRLILRLHNVEYLYYRSLADSAQSIFKKKYYLFESRMLFRYEKSIAEKVSILAVSEKDRDIYQEEFKAGNISYLPVFLPYATISGHTGQGSYCLYHGNLSVVENEKAATWLVQEIFNSPDRKFIVAGRNPSRSLEQLIAQNPNCKLVSNPSDQQMRDLISGAQINVLPSLNQTGVKLKLLNALFNGRHCVVNENAISGSNLQTLCYTGNDAADIRTIIEKLYDQRFTAEDIERRRSFLEATYDNAVNVQKLIQWIW